MSHVTPKQQINQGRILLFGRLPAHKEVGGVTTFTFNIAANYPDLIAKVIDWYPAIGKRIPPNIKTIFINGGRLARFFKLFLIHLEAGYVFHHNFSSIRGLLLTSLFIKKRKTKWLLTLHNGDQQKIYGQKNSVSQFICRRALQRYDGVIALSENQVCFYRSILNNKTIPIYQSSPYIPINEHSDTPKLTKQNSTPHFLTSGFPTKIYRHLETLNVFEKLWQLGHKFSLAVCLYGFDTDGIQQEIEQRINGLSFAIRKSHLDAADFQNELLKTDCYIRMNAVDSFGLIVAEALENNIQVIATDVCERHPGTFLIEKDNFDGLYTVLDKYLNNQRIDKYLPVQQKSDSVISFREIYNRALCE